MPNESIVVIAVDGLRASSLGAYGNTWFDTPNLDQFAAESWLAEWCFASSTDLASIYNSLWRSRHPLRPEHTRQGEIYLPKLVGEHGFRAKLVSDDDRFRDVVSVDEFHEFRSFRIEPTEPANDFAATRFATLLADAAEIISVDSGQFVWVHASGMFGPWDAPLEIRSALADEDDPEPYGGVQAPDLAIDGDDPDVVFPYACAYAAHVQAVDYCLGAFMDQLVALKTQATVIFVGLRGFALGEHGQIGGGRGLLTAPQLHVPLMIRSSDGQGRLRRWQQLTEHHDLLPTIGSMIESQFEAPLDGQDLLGGIHSRAGGWRDHCVAAGSGGERAIRTPSWCLRNCGGDPSKAELFVRPDDVHEINDVSDLRAEVAEELMSALAIFSTACESGEPLSVAPLDGLLTESVK